MKVSYEESRDIRASSDLLSSDTESTGIEAEKLRKGVLLYLSAGSLRCNVAAVGYLEEKPFSLDLLTLGDLWGRHNPETRISFEEAMLRDTLACTCGRAWGVMRTLRWRISQPELADIPGGLREFSPGRRGADLSRVAHWMCAGGNKNVLRGGEI